MKCPYCEDNLAMLEEEAHFDKTQDIVELTIQCPGCGSVFFGTLYKGGEEEKK